jgi:hypothetical protein
LLALILGTADAPGLAQTSRDRFGSLHQLARTSKAQLMKVHGTGEAKAGRLLAVLELSRRLQSPAAPGLDGWQELVQNGLQTRQIRFYGLWLFPCCESFDTELSGQQAER